jgi:hypothetical protein
MDEYGEYIKIYGIAWIYMVKNSKIYYVEFKHLIDPKVLNEGCRPIMYTGEDTVYECSKGIERFIEKHAKAISEIPDEYKYLYTILRKAVPHLFSTQ